MTTEERAALLGLPVDAPPTLRFLNSSGETEILELQSARILTKTFDAVARVARELVLHNIQAEIHLPRRQYLIILWMLQRNAHSECVLVPEVTFMGLKIRMLGQ